MLTEKKFLGDDELKSLLKLLDRHKGQRDSIMIRLALFSAARSIELLKIRKCDLGKNSVTIAFPAKGSNPGTLPLPAAFFKELSEYVKEMKDEDVIFPISTRQFRRIWDQYRPARKPGGHSLRHTLGVKLYNNNKNIHAVQTFLRQKNIQNTMIYLDFVEGVSTLREGTKGMWNKPLAS